MSVSSSTQFPTISTMNMSNDDDAVAVTTEGSLQDCLPYLPPSVFSAAKLGNDDDKQGIIASLEQIEAENIPNIIPSLQSSKVGEGNGAVHGLEVLQSISVKDGCVIGFMLALWLYSLLLMFRAWRRILNFSEDQLNRPEAATVLYRWVMARIKMKRKMEQEVGNIEGQDVENGGAQSNMDIQDIGDIAHEDRLQFTVERKNDCDLSKEIGYNSSIPADSILEEKVNQRDHMEPSNTEENYSTNHPYQAYQDINNISVMDPKSPNQNVFGQPYCVGQATVSMVQMLGNPSFIPPQAVIVPNEEGGANYVEYIRTHAPSTQDSKEEQLEDSDPESTRTTSRNKSKSEVSIPLMESEYNDNQFQGGKEFMVKLPRSTSGGSSGDPVQHYKLETDTRKSLPRLLVHRQSISTDHAIKKHSKISDQNDGDDAAECVLQPKVHKTKSGNSPKPQTSRSSITKLKTHTSDSTGNSMIPHATGHTSQFMDLVMAATATTVKPTVPLYKKRRDTFKRTKTTGVIQSSSGRKAGKTQYSTPGSGIRQDTSASFTSSTTHLGQLQHSLSQNEDPNQTSFEGQTLTTNSSQHSEILADFSRSSNSATYQTTSNDELESSMLHGSIEQLNLPREPELENESINKSVESKDEVVWIDYHPPPNDEKNNVYAI